MIRLPNSYTVEPPLLTTSQMVGHRLQVTLVTVTTLVLLGSQVMCPIDYYAALGIIMG